MPDILLIQKYLNGELNARAMHELERRAFDDPFLAEALEGYAATGKNQQQNIADLQQRLQQRIKPQRKRITLWPTISIAASILVFIGVGGWWLLNYRPASNQPDLPVVDKTEVVKAKPDTTLPQPFRSQKEFQQQAVIKPQQKYIPHHQTVEPKAPGSAQKFEANASINDHAELNKEASFLRSAAKDSLTKGNRLDDVVVVGYGVQRKSVVTGSVSTINVDSIKANQMQRALAGRVAGIQVNTGKPGASQEIRIRGTASINTKGDSVKLVTGQIISNSDKQPLPGVTVRASNGLAVSTDARGRFKIPATDKDELNIAYVGFESQKVKVKGKDSLKVSLKEDHSALSEVVVVGYGTREPEEVINEAHPKNGWSAFYKYLDEEARVSDGKTGVVRISFVVGTDGTLSDFKILSSLNPEADKEAIEIIKDGADWIPNTNKRPETVKLRIRFRKEK